MSVSSASVWDAVLESCSSAPTSRRGGDGDWQHRRLEPATTPIPAGAYFAELPIDLITANPRQPRAVFDEEAMAELVDSIREVGLLQPVVVRPEGDGRFELVMGERRWRAAQRAGLDTIPAIVRQTADHDLLRDALLENLHRAQLNPLEEAAAYAADAGGLRLHSGGAGRPDQTVPSADLQHHPAAATAADASSGGWPPGF